MEVEDDFRETIERTAKNGRIFSIRIDKLDAGMNPRVREVAVEELQRRVLFEDLSQMSEWQLRSWCEQNEFEKTTFLCPRCHGFGPVNVRIVIGRRIRQYLLWSKEADEEVNIYHCENCKSDYKQDDLDIERWNVQLSNENRFYLLVSAAEENNPEEAYRRMKNLAS